MKTVKTDFDIVYIRRQVIGSAIDVMDIIDRL